MIKFETLWKKFPDKEIMKKKCTNKQKDSNRPFANGLKKHTPSYFGKLQKVQTGSFQNTLSDKTGVIFFKEYWQRGRESFENRSGDHIDLWNKSEITSSGMFIRSILEFFGRVSDLNKSREVWFWEVK